jgi:hypothetical protein
MRGAKAENLTGRKFGKLTVLYRVENRHGKTYWMCRCECDEVRAVQGAHLKSGHTSSCGCASPFRTTHGGTYERLYSIWCAMKKRCHNPNASNFHNYGGRGISVCDEWRNDYAAFREWALENGYRVGLEIDRINVNGNYEPSNCRWVPRQVQAHNKTTSRVLEFNGRSQTMPEWADELGISVQTLASRLNKLGWPIERALSAPTRKIRKKVAT